LENDGSGKPNAHVEQVSKLESLVLGYESRIKELELELKSKEDQTTQTLILIQETKEKAERESSQWSEYELQRDVMQNQCKKCHACSLCIPKARLVLLL